MYYNWASALRRAVEKIIDKLFRISRTFDFSHFITLLSTTNTNVNSRELSGRKDMKCSFANYDLLILRIHL